MQVSDLAMLPLIIKISEIVGEISDEEIAVITEEIMLGYPIDNISLALLNKRAFLQNIGLQSKVVH